MSVLKSFSIVLTRIILMLKQQKNSVFHTMQARNYTVKYKEKGVEGLRDRRGKRKSQDEMNELEKLRAEVKILRAEKERAKMEISFLKKLEEIERRRS